MIDISLRVIVIFLCTRSFAQTCKPPFENLAKFIFCDYTVMHEVIKHNVKNVYENMTSLILTKTMRRE